MIFILLTDVWQCAQSVTWECASSTFALISLFHCFFARCSFFFKGQHSPAVSWKGNDFASYLLLKIQSDVLCQKIAACFFTVFYSGTRPHNWGLHHWSKRGRFLCLILFLCWSIMFIARIWCFSCGHQYKPFPGKYNMRHLIRSSWSSVSAMPDSHIDQTTSLLHE